MSRLTENLEKLLNVCEECSAESKYLETLYLKNFKKQMINYDEVSGANKIKIKKDLVAGFLTLFESHKSDILKDDSKWLLNKNIAITNPDIKIGRICYVYNDRPEIAEYIHLLLLYIFRDILKDQTDIKQLKEMIDSYDPVEETTEIEKVLGKDTILSSTVNKFTDVIKNHEMNFDNPIQSLMGILGTLSQDQELVENFKTVTTGLNNSFAKPKPKEIDNE